MLSKISTEELAIHCRAEDEQPLKAISIRFSSSSGCHIARLALKRALSYPADTLISLQILRELLPDSIAEAFENLTPEQQQLRLYWRDQISKLRDIILQLRYLVISNNQAIATTYSSILGQVLGLYSDIDNFQKIWEDLFMSTLSVIYFTASNVKMPRTVLRFGKFEHTKMM